MTAMRLLIIVLLLAGLSAGPAVALAGAGAVADLGGPAVTDNQAAQSGGKTLNEAVEEVRRRYNGRILSAETKRSGNREVHHIKVLTEDGKVITVRVPGRSLRS